jgi:DNA-binding MarR family transcriptional regulator
MDEQARQLSGIIEKMMYYFGTNGMDGECCENISLGEFFALRAVLHRDICTMQDIAKSAVVTKSGATRIVSRLEDKGLAHREQDRKDGRVCCVRLTEEGKSLLDHIEGQLIKKIQTILTAMDPGVREILMIALHAFCQTAERQMANWNPLPSVDGPAQR